MHTGFAVGFRDVMQFPTLTSSTRASTRSTGATGCTCPHWATKTSVKTCTRALPFLRAMWRRPSSPLPPISLHSCHSFFQDHPQCNQLCHPFPFMEGGGLGKFPHWELVWRKFVSVQIGFFYPPPGLLDSSLWPPPLYLKVDGVGWIFPKR